MAEGAAKARAEAVDGFAAALRELRDSIGTPSFRELAGRSRAISHTTLHEAAQGNRLPSWATTVEFVKACGGDPADYRERWEQANETIRLASSPPDAARVDATQLTDELAGTLVEPEPSDPPSAPPDRKRPRYLLPGVAAAAAVAIVVVTIALVARSGDKKDDTTTNGQTVGTTLSPADCPIHQSNPPAAPPLHPGDASTFIIDVTLHDCSHVPPSRTVTKTWRLQNIGTVAWKGYSLHRLDLPQQRNQCQTIDDVPIPDTQPGKQVDISTQVTTPPTAGFCFVRFKMLDASGHVVFPGSRPVNFQLFVD